MDKEKINFRAITERVINELPKLVSEKRLRHIFAVSELSVYLAELFSSLGAFIDKDEVECASMLHDIAKQTDVKEMCQRYGVVLSSDDLACPETIHAIAGAYYARDAFGVSDSVFSAILKHTVGSEEMSLTDNIIFVSDYCEKTRTHTECIEMRKRLLKISDIVLDDSKDISVRLAEALEYLELVKCEILFKTVKYLSGKGDKIHPGTVQTLRKCFEKNKHKEAFLYLLTDYKDIIEQYGI